MSTTPSPTASASRGWSLSNRRTLIGPALSLCAAQADHWAAAVLVTDGQFDDPSDLPPAAQAVARSGLPVLIVPRGPASDAADARLADLTASFGPGGEVRLAATAVANAATQCTLRITRQGLTEPLKVQSLSLLPNDPATIRLADTPPPGAPAVYAAEFDPPDALPANDRLSAIVLPPTPRFLWAGAGPPPPLEAELTAHLATTQPAGLADNVDESARLQALIVQDITGAALSAPVRLALAQYVRLGGGLVFLGTGPFGQPSDLEDPLNQALPLRASPYERKNLDVSVLLDASGSMAEPAATTSPAAGSAGPRKFDLACQATLEMVRRQLAAGDYLRVYTFQRDATLRYAGPAGPGVVGSWSRPSRPSSPAAVRWSAPACGPYWTSRRGSTSTGCSSC